VNDYFVTRLIGNDDSDLDLLELSDDGCAYDPALDLVLEK